MEAYDHSRVQKRQALSFCEQGVVRCAAKLVEVHYIERPSRMLGRRIERSTERRFGRCRTLRFRRFQVAVDAVGVNEVRREVVELGEEG